MNEIPGIARNGVLIDSANHQPEVRRNAETSRDWIYSKEAHAVAFANQVGQFGRGLNGKGINEIHLFCRILSALGKLIG